MRKIKHSLLLVVIVLLCSQFFSSCSSSKMTQAEVAEYYKDLKITGKGINAYTPNTVKNPIEIESEILVKEEITALIEVATIETATLESSPVIATSTEEIVLDTTTPIFTTSAIAEQTAVNPRIESAKEKMEILGSNSSLSKKEKRKMKKEVRKTLIKEIKVQKKEMKEAQKSGQEVNDDDKIIRLILAIFLPPASVGIGRGIGTTFWINVILTLILFLPGVIHALIIFGQDY